MTGRLGRTRRSRALLWVGGLALLGGGALYVQAAREEVKDPGPPAAGAGGVAPEPRCGPDRYGYTCDAGVPFQFVDVSGTGVLVASGDDAVGVQVLGGAGAFRFYGADYSRLAASTNGYLSTDPADDGKDHSNDCRLPAAPSSGAGARLYLLHDDTIADVYYQHFASCPRPPDRGGDAGCHVFTWDSVRHLGGGGPWRQEVLLYEGTGDVTFQIGAGNPEQGLGSTTGVQNGGVTSGLVYASCTAASIPDDTAVTFYNPDAGVPAMDGRAVGLLALLLAAIGAGRLAPSPRRR